MTHPECEAAQVNQEVTTRRRNPSDFVSRTVNSIPPSGIRKFFDLISQTKGVISLGVGEPDFITPWRIREAGIYALERGYTTYTSNQGLLELRIELSKYIRSVHGVYYDPEELLVTVGASEAVDIALRTVIDPGDEVIIPEPTFVSYVPCTFLAGGTPVTVPLRSENHFELSAHDIQRAITPKTKVLLLCNPNNPTGALISANKLRQIAQLAESHDLLVITDEIYCELVYDADFVSFAALPGMKSRTILVGGFSKTFAMTGWRIGYVAADKSIIQAMNKVHQYAVMCAPTMSQLAALEALKNGRTDVQKMVAEYKARRNLIYHGLRELGFECEEPRGAFYIFPSIRKFGLSSEAFAEKLLMQEKVAVVPGNAFGPGGEGHIRCAYAVSREKLKEALARISRFVNSLG